MPQQIVEVVVYQSPFVARTCTAAANTGHVSCNVQVCPRWGEAAAERRTWPTMAKQTRSRGRHQPLKSMPPSPVFCVRRTSNPIVLR